MAGTLVILGCYAVVMFVMYTLYKDGDTPWF